MAHDKERSSLFKFLYTVLSVITFPIFAVLYVLKHPLWVMCLILALCGAVVYFPLQAGVKPQDVPEWYKKKYTEVKYEVAVKSAEHGDSALFSKEELENLADEVAANKGLKSENFNAKVSRDKVMEDVASGLKKRGGFKRKGEITVRQTAEEQNEEPIAVKAEEKDVDNIAVGGLEALLGNTAKEEVETEAAPVSVEETDAVESKPVLPQPTEDVHSVTEQNSSNATDEEFDLF